MDSVVVALLSLKKDAEVKSLEELMGSKALRECLIELLGVDMDMEACAVVEKLRLNESIVRTVQVKRKAV